MIRTSRVVTPAVMFTLTMSSFAIPAFADTDYNGDGRADLALYRADGKWTSVPVLAASGDGGWTAFNATAPSWANEPGVIAVPGDYNRDGKTDLAFYRPDGRWSATPVLLSDGKGGWTAVEKATPSWANQAGVIAVAGDYNGDGATDLAFYRPDGSWRATPVLLSDGKGGWTAVSTETPSWASQAGVTAIAGDFNGDRRTDLVFIRPDGGWRSTPVLLATGAGGWTAVAAATPSWANQPGGKALAGDFNGDHRTDLAFYRPDGEWQVTPLLLATGTGGWAATTAATPSWANARGVVAVAGDFNLDGRTDLAFYNPGSTWATTPILTSNGDGGFKAYNTATPLWANQLGIIAVAGDYNHDGRSDLAFLRPGGGWTTTPSLLSDGKGGWISVSSATPSWAQLSDIQVAHDRSGLPVLAHRTTISDSGDPGYDQTQAQEDAWHHRFQSWANFFLLLLRIADYAQFVIESGLTGDYDGAIRNADSNTQASAYLSLSHKVNDNEVNGRLVILDASLRLDGGAVCSDVVVPVGVLPVHATSNSHFHATGTTTRDISILGLFSGTVDVSFSFTLETTHYNGLSGTIDIDAPWPCSNQHLAFDFVRRPL